jgi:hypothetical protein
MAERCARPSEAALKAFVEARDRKQSSVSNSDFKLQERIGAVAPGVLAGNSRAPKGFYGAGHEGRTRDIYLGKGPEEALTSWLFVYVNKIRGPPTYRGRHERP